MQNLGLARTNYAVRSAAFLLCLVAIGVHVLDRDFGAAGWTLLVLQFAVYPHLVYLRAKHSDKPTRAELDNLMLDSVLLGAWVAAIGFPTWITYMLISATTLNAAVNRGLRGQIYSLACNGAGAALALSIVGFHYWPGTQPFVTTLCFVGSLAYACSVGFIVWRQNRRLTGARDELRVSEARYRLLAENADDLVALIDNHGRWLYSSPSYARVLAEADLEPGTDAFRRLHPEDADGARTALIRAIGTGQSRELVLRLVDREGRVRSLRSRIQPIAGDPGAPKRAELISHDVSELRESEEKLLLAAHALEGMTEGIMITAADGTILTVNRAFSDITGYARDDVIGQPAIGIRNALRPADFYDDVYSRVGRDGYWSGTSWCRRKNGAVYREWRSLRAIRDGSGAITHYVSVFYELDAKRGGDADTTWSPEIPLKA